MSVGRVVHGELHGGDRALVLRVTSVVLAVALDNEKPWSRGDGRVPLVDAVPTRVAAEMEHSVRYMREAM